MLETGVDNLNKNTGISEYETFSDAKAYFAGDTVMYNGLLYTFTTDHVAGAWDESQVESASMKDEFDKKVTELDARKIPKIPILDYSICKKGSRYNQIENLILDLEIISNDNRNFAPVVFEFSGSENFSIVFYEVDEGGTYLPTMNSFLISFHSRERGMLYILDEPVQSKDGTYNATVSIVVNSAVLNERIEAYYPSFVNNDINNNHYGIIDLLRRIDVINKTLENTVFPINPFEGVEISNAFISKTGALSTDENYKGYLSDWMKVQEGDIIKCVGFFGQIGNDWKNVWGYSDNNWNNPVPLGIVPEKNKELNITIPDGVNFVKMCCRYWEDENPYIINTSNYNLDDRLNSLNNTVSANKLELSNEINNIKEDINIKIGDVNIINLDEYIRKQGFVSNSGKFIESSSEIWTYNEIELKQYGTIRIVATSNEVAAMVSIKNGDNDYTPLLKGNSAEQNFDYIAEKDCTIAISYHNTNYHSCTISYNDIDIKKKIESLLSDSNTFIVSKNGNGDFSSLTEAIIKSNELNNATIYVEEGEYDLIEEFKNHYGVDFFENFSSNPQIVGLYLKNRVKIYFSSASKVVCNYTGENANVKQLFSPFNSSSYGFELNNLNLECSNVRYGIHDERSINEDQYRNIYEHCNIVLNNSSNDAWPHYQCIGGGLGCNGEIRINGCFFKSIGDLPEGQRGIVSYHNSSSDKARNTLLITNNYFDGDGTFRFSWYGKSTYISVAQVCGNSFGYEPIVKQENTSALIENVKLISFNNTTRNI